MERDDMNKRKISNWATKGPRTRMAILPLRREHTLYHNLEEFVHDTERKKFEKRCYISD